MSQPGHQTVREMKAAMCVLLAAMDQFDQKRSPHVSCPCVHRDRTNQLRRGYSVTLLQFAGFLPDLRGAPYVCGAVDYPLIPKQQCLDRLQLDHNVSGIKQRQGHPNCIFLLSLTPTPKRTRLELLNFMTCSTDHVLQIIHKKKE